MDAVIKDTDNIAENTVGKLNANANQNANTNGNGNESGNADDGGGQITPDMHMSPRQILEYRTKISSGILSRARGSLTQPLSSCQDRNRISRFLRSLHHPIPMPEELRKHRMKLGLPVPDDSVPYVVISDKNNANGGIIAT